MQYDSEYEAKYGKGPHVAVDAVVICGMQVLLIKRKDGQFALPGGFVEEKETLLDASIRECGEETGLKLSSKWFRESMVFDNPGRDVRSHIISIAHSFVVPLPKNVRPKVQAGSDAMSAFWFPLRHIGGLPLYADHTEILHKMVYRHV